ncbi:ABC transporter permease, partial [Rhizobium ruizarguesonis]
MTIEAIDPAIAIVEKPASLRPVLEWIARRAEPVVIGLAAILIGLALFSLFILAVGKSPATLFQ